MIALLIPKVWPERVWLEKPMPEGTRGQAGPLPQAAHLDASEVPLGGAAPVMSLCLVQSMLSSSVMLLRFWFVAVFSPELRPTNNWSAR